MPGAIGNVLVTGATRRIGAAVVRALAVRGHGLALHHHSAQADTEALADALRAAGAPRVCVVQGELSDPATPAALLSAARAGLGGPIAGLVNNASRFVFDRPERFDYADLDRNMRINCAAPVALATALAGQEDLAEGAVVNLLDQKVANLNPDFFTYTCSKLALAGATTMLAQALAPRVRVNAVSPGLTLPSLDQSAEEFARTADENLLRRPVDLGELAETVVHLLLCRSITGQNVLVDCGQNLVRSDGDVMFLTRERPDA